VDDDPALTSEYTPRRFTEQPNFTGASRPINAESLGVCARKRARPANPLRNCGPNFEKIEMSGNPFIAVGGAGFRVERPYTDANCGRKVVR